MTIVGNLLENAFDAVGALEPARRRVHLTIVDDAQTLLIRVSDRGPGVSDGRAQLIERGFSTKTGHAGVGLALVHDAATAAGGTFDVRGSTFTVTIPSWPPGAR